jgi:hypothetical protein
MPSGYCNLDGWKGYEDARVLYNTYIWNGNKLPKIQVDEWLQNLMATESLAVEVGNADDNNAGDLQSTGNIIGRLVGLDYTAEDGGFFEANAWANNILDIVGDMESNEECTNRLVNYIEKDTWKGSRKCKETEKLAAYDGEGLKKKNCLWE